MTVKTYIEIIKAVIFVFVLAAIGITALNGYAWMKSELDHRDDQLKIELEKNRRYKIYDAEYAANLARADTVIGSLKEDISELEKIAATKDDALKEALDDIKNNNETIFNLGQTVAELDENIRKLRTESSHVYKADTGDINEQYFIDIMYPLKDKDGDISNEIPYAWAIFYPNKPASEKWKYGIYQLDYNIRTIQTKQEDGNINTYSEVWFQNNKRKISKGIDVPIKITSSDFKQAPIPDKRFYLWAPHVSLNLDTAFGTNVDVSVGGGLSFNLSGYGRTKNDLSWKFIEVGLSTNGADVWAKFSPVSYNIGDLLPVISNTFISPFVGYGLDDGALMFGIGLSIPF